MASSRLRALHRTKKAERHQCRQRGGGRDWEIDDRGDFDLDRILSVEEEPIPSPLEESELSVEGDGESLCSSREESEPDIEHSSTWPVEPATKEHESKISFLDLPAEIRILIYELYCQSALMDTGYNHLPVSMHHICNGIPARSLEPRLFCHQIRAEFTPIWARCQTFLLACVCKYHDSNRSPKDLTTTWHQVRDLFDWMGSAEGKHVRSIRVCHIWHVPFPILNSQSFGSMLHPSKANLMVSGFERLADLHEDLKVEVELRSVGVHWDYYFAVRRIFTLRQRPFGRREGPDWTVEIGDVQVIDTASLSPVIEQATKRPHSHYYRDGVWKPMVESILNQHHVDFE